MTFYCSINGKCHASFLGRLGIRLELKIFANDIKIILTEKLDVFFPGTTASNAWSSTRSIPMFFNIKKVSV